jgi:DNA-binding winged helix-turn-helix (wHTH) protein
MSRYRFGIFEFDPGASELRREGVPIRLQAQPAQVLALLLEHAGEIVTRETLQQTVWADGTQVDFERGLNYCIAQVRSALKDSADSPRFVRTIPKKGYQFIAPVERAVTAEAPAASKRRWTILAATLVVTALAGFALANHFIHRVPVVAVCLFDNETGDAALDPIASGFSDAMTVELASAGGQHVKVIGNADILRKSRGERNLDRIHATLGADFAIIGQVQRDAKQYRILAHLLRLPGQTHASVDRLDTPRLDNPLSMESDFSKRAVQRFLKVLE